MSRIGNRPIEFSDKVTVTMTENEVTVKGPKGELTQVVNPRMKVEIGDDNIVVNRPDDSKQMKTVHGTTRTLLSNMVEGVTNGFEKTLELIGVGYRAQLQGKKLVLSVGLSHPVEFEDEDVTVEVPSNTKIIVKGINKERVGALAANIRAVRPPEPYKGKGIRYEGEFVRRKEGKTGK